MDSPFSLTRSNPFRRALDANAEAEAIKQREIEAQQPEVSGPTLHDAINQVAVRTQIPANVLMAISEASGAKTAEEAISAAEAAGNRLSGAVRGGLSMEDALKEAVGDAAISGAILERAKGWADTFDPLGPLADRNRPEGASVIRDVPAGIVGSALSMLGEGGNFVGEQTDELIDKTTDTLINRPMQAITGNPDLQVPRSSVGRAVGRGIDYVVGSAGDYVEGNFVSKEAAKAAQDSGFEGNILEPSTWGVKDDSSTRGFLQQGANIVGSMLPVILTKSPTAAAATGVAMGGGEGAASAEQLVRDMAGEITQGGASTKLQDESKTYRDARAAGMDHDGALNETIRQARLYAGAGQAIISGIGGALTNRIVRGGQAAAAGSGSRAARAAGGAATSGFEEGVQEVGEGAAAAQGANIGAGTNAPIMDDSVNNFMLGAMGGAVPGGIAGAMSPTPRSLDLMGEPIDDVADEPRLALPPPAIQAGGRGPFDGRPLQDPSIAQQPANIRPVDPALPPAPPAPPMVLSPDQRIHMLPAPSGPTATPPASQGALMMPGPVAAPAARPSGPLAGARDKAPAPLFEGLKPGQQAQIVLRDQPNAPIYAALIEETAIGLTFDDTVTGKRYTIPRAEIETGEVSVRFADPSVREVGSMPPAPLGRPAKAGPAPVEQPEAPQQGPNIPFGAPEPLNKPTQRGIEDVTPSENEAADVDQPIDAGQKQPGEPPAAVLPDDDEPASAGSPDASGGAIGGAVQDVPEVDRVDNPVAAEGPRASEGADLGGSQPDDGLPAPAEAGEQPADLSPAPAAAGDYAPEQPGTKETMRRDYPPPAIYGKGEVLTTSSGRSTSPFPHIKTGTPARYRNNVKRVNDWFMAEALAEARARGDEFAARTFEQDQGKGDKIPPASLDQAADYLGLTRNPVSGAVSPAKPDETGKVSPQPASEPVADPAPEEKSPEVARDERDDVPAQAGAEAETSPLDLAEDQEFARRMVLRAVTRARLMKDEAQIRYFAAIKPGESVSDDDMRAAVTYLNETQPEMDDRAIDNGLATERTPPIKMPPPLSKAEPKAEEAQDDAAEDRADAETWRSAKAETPPAKVKGGQTGDDLGKMTAARAYGLALALVKEKGERWEGGFFRDVDGDMSSIHYSRGQWWGRNRVKDAESKVFFWDGDALDAIWFDMASLKRAVIAEKEGQGDALGGEYSIQNLDAARAWGGMTEAQRVDAILAHSAKVLGDRSGDKDTMDAIRSAAESMAGRSWQDLERALSADGRINALVSALKDAQPQAEAQPEEAPAAEEKPGKGVIENLRARLRASISVKIPHVGTITSLTALDEAVRYDDTVGLYYRGGAGKASITPFTAAEIAKIEADYPAFTADPAAEEANADPQRAVQMRVRDADGVLGTVGGRYTILTTPTGKRAAVYQDSTMGLTGWMIVPLEGAEGFKLANGESRKEVDDRLSDLVARFNAGDLDAAIEKLHGEAQAGAENAADPVAEEVDEVGSVPGTLPQEGAEPAAPADDAKAPETEADIGKRWNKMKAPSKRVTLAAIGIVDEEAAAIMAQSWSAVDQAIKDRIFAQLTGGKRETVEDFGTILTDSRKFNAKRQLEELFSNAVDARRVAERPLADTWPEPDYEALIANGMTAEAAAAIAILRNFSLRKPTKASKAKEWAQRVMARLAGAKLISEGAVDPKQEVEDHAGREGLILLELMAISKPEDFADLSRVQPITEVGVRDYNIPYGQEGWYRRDYLGMRLPWHSPHSNGLTFGPDEEPEVIRNTLTRAFAERRASNRTSGGREKPVTLTVEARGIGSGATVYFIGYNLGAGVNEVYGEFATKEAAETYLEDNRDDLLELADEMRVSKYSEWLTERRPRSGPKWRTGNVTKEMFTEAFGEDASATFGNWNSADDRQDRLNETYDAMMDMAAVLGVPPKSLLLNGTLRFSFGARGKGGRNPAAAHYETNRGIINLTKGAGAGTLAHEWFHAIDNFIANLARKASTEPGVERWERDVGKRGRKDVNSDYSTSTTLILRGAVSPEIRAAQDAAIELRAALRTEGSEGAWFERSKRLDQQRGGEPYFATTIELAARAFERAVYDRLAERGMANDFLVGIDLTGGAYPTPREARRAGIDAAMGKLMAALGDIIRADGDAATIRTADLPPIDPDYGYKGVKIGQTWTGENGELRRVVSEAKPAVDGERRFFMDLGRKEGDELDVWTESAIERLFDRDAEANSPENAEKRAARDEAKRIEDQRKAEKLATTNEIKDKARAFIREHAGEAEARRLLAATNAGYNSVSMMNMPSHPIVAAWTMFESGYRQKGASAKAYFVSKNGAGWQWKSTTAPFREMMDLLQRVEAERLAKESAEKDDKAPNKISDEDAAHLFGGPKPAPAPAADPEPTPEDAEPTPQIEAEGGGVQPNTPEPAPEPTPAPRNDNVGGLTKAEQDRLAALRDQFRKKMKNQLNSGLDPELVAIAAEMAGIYIKAGARRFRDLVRAMIEDLEMSFDTIQPYARSAYNQVRGDLELADENIDGMDDDKAVIAEIRAIKAEEKAKAEAAEAKPKPEAQPQETGGQDEPEGDRGGDPQGVDQGRPEGGEGAEIAGPSGGGGRKGGNGGGGNRNNGSDGDVAPGGVERGGDNVPEPAGDISGENPGNYQLTDADNIGTGSDGAKIKANIAAIRIIKALDAENRYPTREEQAALAKYVGWGGLKTVFDPKKEGVADQYGRAQAELRELLTKDEYEAAFDSVKNAHYTAPGVVRAMWQAMQSFGFNGGRALEPTVGTGNFIGFQPEDMAESTEWHASELDAITGRIAKALYPDANIMAATGFENAPFARGVFDIAIGNPPFGQEPISRGREKDLLGLKIHNYIIAKTGRHLRPGGIMAMVVTHRFLDTRNDEARSRLAQDFRFMGAIRLPNDAFLENAGTEVVTDIVFFQKLKDGEQPDLGAAWLDTEGKLPGDIRVNRYFAENPQNILGRSAMDGTMYGAGGKKGEEYTVHGDGRDITAAISEVIQTGTLSQFRGALGSRTEALEAAVAVEEVSTLALGQMMLDGKDQIVIREDDGPGGVHRTSVVTEESYWKNLADEWRGAVDAMEKVKETMAGGMLPTTDAWDAFLDATAFLYTGGVMRREKAKPTQAEAAIYAMVSAGKPLRWGKVQKDAMTAAVKARDDRRLGKEGYANVKAQLDLRRRLLSLIRAERTEATTESIEKLRSDLKGAYEAYVAKYGFVNNARNRSVMRDDQGPEMGLEGKYEAKDDDRAESAEQASILSKRVYFPYKVAESADTPADGLLISISERGRVDIPFIAALTGMDTTEVISDLTGGDNPRIFLDPDTSEYVDAESYLSGNVKLKLKLARDEGLTQNVKALEAALPADLPKERISPVPRSLWMPPEIFEDFLRDLGAHHPKVRIFEEAGVVSIEASLGSNPSDFGLSFRHDDATPVEMFRSIVSGKPMSIYRGKGDDRVLDEVATREVNAIAARMAREFEKWAYQNGERTEKIVAAFNEKMNTHVERKFDGVKYLKTVGMNPALKLRNSQKNGAWRMMLSTSSLMHHVVGAGKTFTAITAVMERRRMGLSQKPMIVVPNHLVEQWAADFRFAYPGAKLLAATKNDFEASKRKRLFGRIATGDYDAIIIGHSSLNFIENDPADIQRIIEEQLEMLKDALEEARKDGSSKRSLTQIRNAIKRYEDKLKKLEEKLAERTDALGLTFRSMGVDYLVVDEAHEFKNLEYQTGANRLVGMNDPKGSQRAFNLYIKTRTLLDQNTGRDRNGVGFLTGTPISNSLVEIYSVMKYLAPQDMKDRGIAHFDAWSGAYIQAETRFEYNATQKLVERTVMSGLVNLQSLSQLYRQFADVILSEQLYEIYAEQIREENRQSGGNKSEKFPVPKVKDGGRQLDSAPASPLQMEYTDYLAARMLGMKNATDKKAYASIDNQLWVLSDARKASVDIRTVDPEQPREETSKVARAAAKIVDKWKETAAVKGTQLVFCDLSTPKKNARTAAINYLIEAMGKTGMSAKAARETATGWAEARDNLMSHWNDLLRQIADIAEDPNTKEEDRDRLTEWLDANSGTEPLAAMNTFDTGFSVYDDMKAAMIEKGIPSEQIAFIHDHDSDKAKAKLFADVNSGRVRVLMGSTPKMGAGTNVQQRLVALHHMDSPWRPSDVEQREGRIIRAGNKLYEADPENFTVDIWAYSTEGTSDVVLWQVLERKARAIEQFLSGTLDKMVEEDADSDKYAEFMAQSTGNPVFLRKLETERDLLNAESEIAGLRMARVEGKNFLEVYDARMAQAEEVISFVDATKVEAAQILGSSAPPADPADLATAMDAYREEYRLASEAHEAEVAAVEAENAALKAQGKRQKAVPKFEMAQPSPLADGVLEKSSYARMVKAALEKIRNSSNNTRIQIQFGGSQNLMLEIAKDATNIDPRKSDYSVYLVYGDAAIRKRRGRQLREAIASSRVIDPTSSYNLIAAFNPSALERRLAEIKESAQATQKRLSDERPEMERRAEMEVDEKRITELRALLEFYKADVAIAESKREAETKNKPPNRYIAMDDMPDRIFGSESGQLVEDQVDFEVKEGTDFDGTYRGTGIGAVNPFSFGTIFEAINEKNGQRGLFIAMQERHADMLKQSSKANMFIQTDDVKSLNGEWVAQGFIPDPHSGGTDQPDIGLLSKERRAEKELAPVKAGILVRNRRKETVERLKAEMARMNIPQRVNVKLEDFIMSSGIKVMGKFDIAGKDAGQIGVSLGYDDIKGEGTSLGTLRHEIIHALRSPEIWDGAEFGLFTREEWTALVRAARNDREVRAWVRKHYGDFPQQAQTEEAVAEFFSRWAATQEDRQSGPLNSALARIRDMVLAIARAIAPWAAPKMTGADVARAIMDGRIGGRGPDGPGSGITLSDRLRREANSLIDSGQYSKSQVEAELGVRLRKADLGFGRGLDIKPGKGVRETGEDAAKWGKSVTRHALTQAMSGNYNLLALVPGRGLYEELGRNMMSAQAYLKTKGLMDTMRNELTSETDALAQKWLKLTGWRGKAKENEVLMDIMHRSTIWQVDPTKDFEAIATREEADIASRVVGEPATSEEARAVRAVKHDASRKVQHAALKSEFAKLPAEHRAMYREVRDAYGKMQERYDDVLKENIDKVAEITVKRAHRTFQKKLDQIEEDGDLSKAERAEAIEAAEKVRDRTISTAKQGAAARGMKMRKLFESNRLKGPYFPLSRFGDFFVTVRDKQGNVVRFSRFEKRWQQEEAAEAERKAGNRVEVGVLRDQNAARNQVDPRFVSEVEGILAGADVPKEAMDAIWQRWLETLPEVSVRKNRIHRKGTEGFQRDALRAFSYNMFHSGHQLARLKYGLQLQDHLDEAFLEAAKQPDPNRAGLVVREMEKRHEFAMNPTGGAAANLATSAAFIWYLGMTPAAALVNLSQTTMIGIPVLSNIHKGKGSGIVAAADEIQLAARQFLQGKGAVEKNPNLTDDERKAIKAAYDMGTIDRSQAHDLAGLAESGVAYSPVRTKVMGYISFMFHHTERMNREVTFMAAYRLARKSGETHESAIETAAEATWRTHFDYTNSSRPRIMQNDAAKVLLVFRNYSVNALWRLFRDAHQAFSGETEQVRKEARRQLFGITGMMMLHAGVSGTWLFGVTMMIAGLFFPGGADEAEDEFKSAIVDTLGPTLGGALWYGTLGQATGIDLTSRIGMPDLWFRSPDKELEGEDAYNYWLGEVAGAVPGIAESWFRGLDLVADGHYWRGAEALMPKAARDLLRAGRYAAHGVETTKGDPILEEASALDVLRQAAGFTPARVAERYDINSSLKNREARIMTRRQVIMSEAASAMMEGKAIPERALAEIASFNKDFPEYPITMKSLRQSVSSRRRMRERSEFGITLNPRLNDRLRAEAPPIVNG